VFAIKHLADKAAQVVFADFATFMLERTVSSMIDPDENELQELVLQTGQSFATHHVDWIARLRS
jgi:hypothetical protein